MHVAAILKDKGSKVVTTRSEATVAETVSLLSHHRIGAAVVTDPTGRVIGMISERDVIRGIASHGPQCLARPVGDLMTKDVVGCHPEDTVAEIMSVMTNRRIRHLPVVEDGVLAGIISIGDVVKNRLDEAELEVAALRDYVSGRL